MAQDDMILSGSLQESLITLLAFNDAEGRTVLGMLTPQFFDEPYRNIAERIMAYRVQHKLPPGTAHLDDIFDMVLEGTDADKADMVQQILSGMVAQAPGLNALYLVNRVGEFVRRQVIKKAILQASELYALGGDDVADRAGQLLSAALKQHHTAMTPGIYLDDVEASLEYLDAPAEQFPIGIKELDKYGISPTRREMLLYIAARKRGKTWAAIHIGKHGLLARKKVLHISLEMSAMKITQRYHQSLFSVAKRDERIMMPKIILDGFGNVQEIRRDLKSPRMNFQDPEIRRKLEAKIRSFGMRMANLVVRGFPSGTLSIDAYQSYLDYLESHENFVPDEVIFDYPDLMKLDVKNLRTSLGQVYVQLRGIADERNHAIVAFTQGTRAATDAKEVTETDVAEDISKVATADTILTYSQTKDEKKLGLARILVAAARNDMDGYSTLISQNYATGQYCLSSAPANGKYDQALKRASGDLSDGDDED